MGRRIRKSAPHEIGYFIGKYFSQIRIKLSER